MLSQNDRHKFKQAFFERAGRVCTKRTIQRWFKSGNIPDRYAKHFAESLEHFTPKPLNHGK